MANSDGERAGYEAIPFRMHPRVFAALGADLVTNDVVAVIELVKNSYDAFASNVWVRIGEDPDTGEFIEIEDDGHGMNKEIIEDAWCMVATPFKETNPLVRSGKRTRRVVGEKGLGRLSVARLGKRFHMFTQQTGESCWEVDVNWDDITQGDDMSKSVALCREAKGTSPFRKSGTLLRISGLRDHWDENRISDLEHNLARLISPFSEIGEFNILLSRPGAAGAAEVIIESPEFLTKPKYSISGDVDEQGTLRCVYRFNPIREGAPRKSSYVQSWEQVYEGIQDKAASNYSKDRAHCGAFSFDIRAWDIGSEDTREIAEQFSLQKSVIRKAISSHKGISVYRDQVLVLPKSESARDWLGLDLRRISKVGTRLSTSQLVGYVAISAETNPNIDDTSDRERLAQTQEVAEFKELLKAAVSLLENARDEDRTRQDLEVPMKDIFEDMTAEKVVAQVSTMADEGADASDVLPVLNEFALSLENARKAVQDRFVFYSRLATVGTIAEMIVHEIRNRTTAIDSFLNAVKETFWPVKDTALERKANLAGKAVVALERLADNFAPLANRTFKRRKQDEILEEHIEECLRLQEKVIVDKGIVCHVPKTKTHIEVDPAELDTVLLNLINNSVYWLLQSPKGKRELSFGVKSGKDSRVQISVDDTGPGIPKEESEMVFLPGVTRKPGGIGMGLTVASELVAEYDGKMSVRQPGAKGGASFVFDLPLTKHKARSS
jgi:signal transduction histidine kinase